MRKLLEEHLRRVEWDQWQFPVRLYPYVNPVQGTAERPIAIDPKSRSVGRSCGAQAYRQRPLQTASTPVISGCPRRGLTTSLPKKSSKLCSTRARRELVYFTDRDLGKAVPAILADAGLKVERHGELFKPEGSASNGSNTAASMAAWRSLTTSAFAMYPTNWSRDPLPRAADHPHRPAANQ